MDWHCAACSWQTICAAVNSIQELSNRVASVWLLHGFCKLADLILMHRASTTWLLASSLTFLITVASWTVDDESQPKAAQFACTQSCVLLLTTQKLPPAILAASLSHCVQVYVGSDKLSMDTLQNDMDGVIGGGGSSVLARPFVEIWHAHQRGDLQRARALQDIMNKW